MRRVIGEPARPRTHGASGTGRERHRVPYRDAVRRIGVPERRARLALRHGLARRLGSVDEAAAAMVGLHSSDPTTVYLSAWARVDGLEPGDVADALYERRSLVRILGMRQTLFVVPRHLAAVIDTACTKALGPPERRRLLGMLESQGVADPGKGAAWLRRVERATLRALEARGEATARELTKDVPELGTRLSFGEGTTWAGTMGVSTRMLFLLAAHGSVVRARPLGTWVSGQYRWARTETWLGEPLEPLDHAAACDELLLRWLRAFGPGTMTDLRWWTGWTVRLTTATLARIGAVEVKLEDGVGYLAPDDLDPEDAPGWWVAFVPSLDPTVMGWKQRTWYLGPHERALFDRNGNAGPTVWADGRVVGGWVQRDDGEIALELVERVSARTRKRIEAERERLRAWLGDARIRSRFATPLERRLAAG